THHHRPARHRRHIHPTVLAVGDRPRPRSDGRDAGRRRNQSPDPPPCGLGRDRPRHPGPARLLRDVREQRRMAVRDRSAREIRGLRRHRRHRPGQGGLGHLLSEAGLRRQQRARPARLLPHLPRLGHEPVRLDRRGRQIGAGRTSQFEPLRRIARRRPHTERTPMSTETAHDETEERRSWAPMVGLFLAQVLMSFNVAALPISLGGMVEDFGVAPTVASSTIVVYGLAVAALVMTGAKLGQRIGWVLIFRMVLVVFAASSVLMISSRTVAWVVTGQLLAGAAAAIIVPALVALVAENYRGAQQAAAVGSLGSARAFSGMSAFLIGGTLGTFVGWRPIFLITLGLAVIVFALTFTLKSDKGNPSIRIDLVASVLIGLAVVLLTMGFNNLNAWGIVRAEDGAPFTIAGLSPAPVFIVVGVVFVQLFFMWTKRRVAAGKVPLVDISVLGRPSERAAVYAMFVIVAMEAAVNFTVPTYIQVVQGREPFATSLAMLPFNLTVFVTATLIVRFYKRYSPRAIAL